MILLLTKSYLLLKRTKGKYTVINKNLINLTEKLKNNSKYLEKMKDIKNSQELYDYCLNIVGGYSKEEFDTFMQRMISTNLTLKALSDDNLASVSGGALKDWFLPKMLAHPTIPTMPKTAHEFRLKVAADETGQGGQWTNNINEMTGWLSQISAWMEAGRMIYFDDLENMSPAEAFKFLDDMTKRYG